METAATDPFLFDMDRLEQTASSAIIRRGIAYFKENRVTNLFCERQEISAQVEGSRVGDPYTVYISLDDEGEPLISCDCPFDWEPVCKHGVAVLLAYEAEARADQETLSSAVDSAVADRAKRGRTEVKVEHVAGHPCFGTWRARSVSSPFSRSYDVQIRSLDARRNACSCPDFLINRLGTCKHIESVLHRLGQEGAERPKDLALAFFYLSWDEPEAPVIRLDGMERLSPATRAVLGDRLDAEGRFLGRVPEDFHAVSQAVDGRDDLLIGRDVRDHVQYLSEQALRGVEAARISRLIKGSGGVLPGVRARLYPYQVEGVSFLASMGRALLADDMGLGKTLQSIAAASWLREHRGVTRTLIVCPTSLKSQWAREIEKFTKLPTRIIEGNPAARRVAYRDKRAAFLIVNYEIVLRDVDEINEELPTDLLILDEAQRLKNWRTKTAAAIKMIQSRYLFVLTGTPLENRLEDLYSLVQLIDPRILGPLWRFEIDFHVTSEGGRVLGYRNLSELRRRVEPVMLRRDRRLVREQLPERIEQRLDVPMSKRQRDLHDEALSAAGQIAQITKRRPLTPSERNRMMAALQNARMACNAAGLVDKKTEGSPKLDELERLLTELCVEQGEKVVVFSQWERMTAMAEVIAHRLALGVVRLHGGVPSKKRGPLMDSFREDPSIQVFLSTDAGGVGLNLQAASFLINLDMPWNPAVLGQRIGRVHRLGQDRVVQVVLMVASRSYEERVSQLVQGKQELFDNVVSEDATEDVVGVTKKVIETLAADLAGEKDPADRRSDGVTEPGLTEGAPAAGSAEEPDEKPAPESALGIDDLRLREQITALQRVLGSSLECVLGTGRSLMAVVTELSTRMENEVQALDSDLPIALIDSRSYHALKTLGDQSPLAHAEIVSVPEEGPTTNPYTALAKRKLEAARALRDREMGAESLPLLRDAMVAAVCRRGNVERRPSSGELAVWLYGTALPKGYIEPEEAASVSRALALADSIEVPGTLMEEVMNDAMTMVASLDALDAVT